MLDRRAANLEAVACRVLPMCQRVDDHADAPALDHLDDIRAALMHLADDLDVDAERRDNLRCALRRRNLEIELRECLRQLLELILILIRHRKEQAALGRHIEP